MIGDAAVLGISQNPYDANRNLITYDMRPAQTEMVGLAVSADLTNIAVGAVAFGIKIKSPTTLGSSGQGSWAGIYIEDTSAAVGALVASYGIYQVSGSSRFSDLTIAGALNYSGSTANRIPYLNASKNLITSANLAFDGTTITLGSGNLITAATGATTLGSTLAVTGAITASNLTASRAVFTDGSKTLVSNAITGSGNVVMSNSPIGTGTWDLASATLSGNLSLTSTATPVLTVGANTTTSPQIVMNGAAGNRKRIRFQTAGVDRWTIRQGNTAESGSDAGSEFELTAFNDAGAGIDNPISIARATGGTMTLSRPISMSSTLGVTGAITASNLTASSLVATTSGKVLTSTVSGLSPGFTGLSLSGLTASQAVFTDASKNLVSNAVTGTGSVVMSSVLGSYPTGSGTANTISMWTGTGTLGNSVITYDGTESPEIIVGGILTTTSQLNVAGDALLSSALIVTQGASIGNGLTVSMSGGSWFADAKITSIGGTVSFGEANHSGYGLLVSPTFTEFSSGTHPLFAGSYFATPIVTSGAAAVTNTATVYIQGAATATVTGANYALWVAAGTSLFAGAVSIGGAITASNLTASQAIFTDASKNLVSNAITGTGNVVMSTSPTMVTPVLGEATATSINFGDAALSKYKEGSFTGTLTGCSGSPTGTIKYTIVGKNVTLVFPVLTGTSTSGACTITGMPAEIRPAGNTRMWGGIVNDNSIDYPGLLYITAAGVINPSFLIAGAYSASFTSSGTKGIGYIMSVSYSIQ